MGGACVRYKIQNRESRPHTPAKDVLRTTLPRLIGRAILALHAQNLWIHTRTHPTPARADHAKTSRHLLHVEALTQAAEMAHQKLVTLLPSSQPARGSLLKGKMGKGEERTVCHRPFPESCRSPILRPLLRECQQSLPLQQPTLEFPNLRVPWPCLHTVPHPGDNGQGGDSFFCSATPVMNKHIIPDDLPFVAGQRSMLKSMILKQMLEHFRSLMFTASARSMTMGQTAQDTHNPLQMIRNGST